MVLKYRVLTAKSAYRPKAPPIAARQLCPTPRSHLRRMVRVVIAPINGHTASARSARAKLSVRLLTIPTRYGPRNPPRLPTELISAMPAAAPVPLRNSDDIAQNGPSVPQIPTAAKESAASSAAGILRYAAAVKPTAPVNAAAAT